MLKGRIFGHIKCALIAGLLVSIFLFTAQGEAAEQNATFWSKAGDTYFSSNQPYEAILAYSKAIEADPNYETPYNNRGII